MFKVLVEKEPAKLQSPTTPAEALASCRNPCYGFSRLADIEKMPEKVAEIQV